VFGKSSPQVIRGTDVQVSVLFTFEYIDIKHVLIIRLEAITKQVWGHVHSLRASGVISSHSARTAGVPMMAALKSAGIVCTRLAGAFGVVRATPPAILSLVILSILHLSSKIDIAQHKER